MAFGINIQAQNSYNVHAPIYRNTPQKQLAIFEAKRKFFIVGGTLFFLAESAVFDAYKVFKESKLYAHKPKVWARDCYDALNGGGESIDDIIRNDADKGYELWTDITDTAQEYTREALMHLRVAVSNYMLKHCKKDARVKTEMVYSCILYGMAVIFFDEFIKAEKKRTGFDLTQYLIKYRCENTYRLWENATLALTKGDAVEGAVTKDQAVINAHNAFFVLINGEGWFNNVCKEAMISNGNYDDVVKQLEENDEAKREEDERRKLGLDRLKEKYIVKDGK